MFRTDFDAERGENLFVLFRLIFRISGVVVLALLVITLKMSILRHSFMEAIHKGSALVRKCCQPFASKYICMRVFVCVLFSSYGSNVLEHRLHDCKRKCITIATSS